MTTPDLTDPLINEHIKNVQNGVETWCVFGYVPKSNIKIKFYECGNGGLSELREELSDSSIRYAYIRYQINNMPKFCYIAWCGDGVNGPIKGSFSSHSSHIGTILKPLHYQLNARNEDDLDEKAILASLTKATGASYDSGAKIQGTSRASVAIPTSVAQGRVQATQSSIQNKSFDKSDYNKKDESATYWKNTNTTTVEPVKAKPDRSDYNITTERENYWKQQQQEEQSKPAAPAPSSRPTGAPSRTVANRFQEVTTQQQTTPVKPPPPKPTGNIANRFQQMKVSEPEPEPVQQQYYEEPQQQHYEEQAYEEPQQTYEEPQQDYYEEPQQQHYDESQQHYDDSQQHYDESQQHYDDSQQQHYDESQQHYDESQQHYDDSQQHYDESQQYDQSAAASGVQVRALYDYQGENEGDLSFAQGEIINVLDQSDPSGWWQGELNGNVGYFPSNFAEQL